MRYVLWITFFLTCSLHAQENLQVIRHYTRQDGLSHSSIIAIREDSRGFLWLATQEGLNRFDGVTFKTYFHDKNEAQSLAHNNVTDILEYTPGKLLIATLNGLCVLNTITDRFENDLITYERLKQGNGSFVLSLFQHDGKIWVNHDGEVDVLDENLNHSYTLTDEAWAAGLKGALIRGGNWNVDKHGRMWLPSDTSGNYIVDFNNRIVFSRRHNPDNLPFMKFIHIRCLKLDEANDALWVAPWGNGLYKYRLSDHSVMEQLFGLTRYEENSSLNFVSIMKDGSLICVAGGNILNVNTSDLSYSKVTIHQQADRMPSLYGFCYLDSERNGLWIGAMEGLLQLDQFRAERSIVLYPKNEQATCDDILIGRNKKLYAIFRSRDFFEIDEYHTRVDKFEIKPTRQLFYVSSLLHGPDDQIWIGTSDGIKTFHPGTKQIAGLMTNEPMLDTGYINEMFLDSKGYTWIATRIPFHLFRYKSTGKPERIQNEAISKFMEAGTFMRVSSIVEDNTGNLWMTCAAGGGILQFNSDNDSWTLHPTARGLFDRMSKTGIISFMPDPQGNLWMSTYARDGLIRFDDQQQQIDFFSRNEGLMSNLIQGIMVDKDGHLLLSSEFGITVFDPVDQKVISNIPFLKPVVNYYALYDESKNTMVLDGPGQLLEVSIGRKKYDEHLPSPMIDGIYVNNKRWNFDPYQKNVRLNQDERNITIEFTAPYFQPSGQLHFAYQLVGADPEWKQAKDIRSAQYAVLSPGHYTFRIKAGNEQGYWGESIDAFSFTIVPPFWRTPWFVAGCLLITGVAIYLLSKNRIARIRDQAALRQKIAETEMMALRAQMNPHFIFNSLNSIDALIHNNDKYQATMYLNKFAKLIRNILDSSKQNTISVAKDLENIRLYIDLEKMRSENSFTEEIRIDPVVLLEDIRVPPLIMQPYVENAILHGLRNRSDDLGRLLISIERRNGHLHYVIEDNGVGRKSAMNGRNHDKTSYGMQMSSDRIKLFNKEDKASVQVTDLEVDGVGVGTRVEILLNLK